ncbi:MAG: hypothetical protein UT33_C0017G0015 [Candidatus Peregrinibacteria bacterium GW2011_GWC2_39_14]|nr:MAG: hypothetical protein US92_C0007G0038 [Candidatus Peregrinibacteria bacterium GW2011_GWA2_38_36]KKR04744.1 MAG: hypothetical protein UT33_C0017G0015 [Candidatus Peregrinibacteria bacterium GW2011_GWC2_39_14]
MGIFFKSFQQKLKALLLKLSIEYGLNETDIDKLLRMAHAFRAQDVKTVQKIADTMIKYKLFEKPEDQMVNGIREKMPKY